MRDDNAAKIETTRRARGPAYTLDEFRITYHLSSTEAERLFKRIGPSKLDLDILMKTKGQKKTNPSILQTV